ncbi:MAG TPA: TlpA disulfide reductase family protein [Bryobacteraceae bacterium]|nr:TlpA disulfide reductase family protein [Bryobacteraceae bacterium]
MKLLSVVTLLLAPLAIGQSLSGLWDASVNVKGVNVPFRFEIAGEGASVSGTFFNGDVKFTSSSGRYANSQIDLKWDYTASRLQATVQDGVIKGTYTRVGRDETTVYPFEARHFAPSPLASEDVPQIAGLWIIPTKSKKGENAWQFIVRQSGPEVSAAILRIDGDTGALQGAYKDGKFLLSHFSGARPAVFEVKPAADGTLELLENGRTKFTAIRADQAKANGLPEPSDPSKFTSLKDPTKPFTFAFHDLNGKLVTNEDPRFAGKVVLINITGSWCPNCHDEAPFLVAMYRKYRAQGLELVALDFEEADQLKDPERLRAFLKKYGIEYTVLLAGDTAEATEKLSQAQNWSAWPTTFFIGRDGLVRGTHAGFPSSASGELFAQAKEDFEARVVKLLNENALTQRQ